MDLTSCLSIYIDYLVSQLHLMFVSNLKLPLGTSVSLFLRTSRRWPLRDIITGVGKRRHAVLATAMKSAKNVVNIVEVGPRDGLQNEKGIIPVEVKVELINRLVRAGVMSVEAGSFVRPEWVPQVCIYILDFLSSNGFFFFETEFFFRWLVQPRYSEVSKGYRYQMYIILCSCRIKRDYRRF